MQGIPPKDPGVGEHCERSIRWSSRQMIDSRANPGAFGPRVLSMVPHQCNITSDFQTMIARHSNRYILETKCKVSTWVRVCDILSSSARYSELSVLLLLSQKVA